MSRWPLPPLRRPAPGHVTNADIELFGRRLRLGEEVDLADVDRMERACDRITKVAPVHGSLRQTALRVLRYISDWRKAQRTTTTAVVDQPHRAAEAAAKQKGPNDERT